MENNPAVRLYNLTQRLRSTSGKGPPARLWAQALDIPINRQITGPLLIQVVQGILAFLDLLNETETGIKELEFDEFYSEAFPPLKLVAHVSLSNLRANQSNLTRPITDETITLLRVIALEWENKKPALPKRARTQARATILWSRFCKVAAKLFEIVKVANDARRTIDALRPFLRLLGARHEIPPVDVDRPDKE